MLKETESVRSIPYVFWYVGKDYKVESIMISRDEVLLQMALKMVLTAPRFVRLDIVGREGRGVFVVIRKPECLYNGMYQVPQISKHKLQPGTSPIAWR
jgi:hypothetical protein